MNNVLITGGTGSFGNALVKRLFTLNEVPSRIVIYSRDELKQYEMRQRFPADKYPQLRFFIGDVRDGERLTRAMEGVDTVVHAAALKQVPTAEYNPFECIQTNVMGAQNVITAALQQNVHKVVALSTDKACAPINLYGATKLCSDKLFIAANNIKGPRSITFSVVRYGNVMGSRGSVIPFFLERRNSGTLPITDPRMTRFNILLSEGVDLVLTALKKSLGGELFVPKIPSYRITDVAKAIGPDCTQEIVGIRAGEKLHEEMITAIDSLQTLETDDHFIIVPSHPHLGLTSQINSFAEFHEAQLVPEGFSYRSDENAQWLTIDDIRNLIETQTF
ncbi:UDP-N-acetylglucosamine 4,6-dehydratase (inverting) [Bremerella alba]|uniref:UDP-N-acetylglucosamine 4,6-dehydratase (Inverting) n=1 Tax=Bremerella alba TaxID=980252 RepID=A0A7V8V0X7_9BACT|nr:UDP-N-acetylglucosamine 4,6-dehydratase (inverting) [Bremerella alba]MBA2112917.1 UDP-N-acetylglucosamine 4,6-dehydratase (inverting) [Bremerella alba]